MNPEKKEFDFRLLETSYKSFLKIIRFHKNDPAILKAGLTLECIQKFSNDSHFRFFFIFLIEDIKKIIKSQRNKDFGFTYDTFESTDEYKWIKILQHIAAQTLGLDIDYIETINWTSVSYILFGQKPDAPFNIIELYNQNGAFFQNIPENTNYASIINNTHNFQTFAAAYNKNQLGAEKIFATLTSLKKIHTFLLDEQGSLTIETIANNDYPFDPVAIAKIQELTNTIEKKDIEYRNLEAQLKSQTTSSDNTIQKLQAKIALLKKITYGLGLLIGLFIIII